MKESEIHQLILVIIVPLIIPLHHRILKLTDPINISIDLNRSIRLRDLKIILVIRQRIRRRNRQELRLVPLDRVYIDEPSERAQVDGELNGVLWAGRGDSLDIRALIVLVAVHPNHAVLLLENVNPVFHFVSGLFWVAEVFEVVAELECLVQVVLVVEDVTGDGSVHAEALLPAELDGLGAEVALLVPEEWVHLSNESVFNVLEQCIESSCTSWHRPAYRS